MRCAILSIAFAVLAHAQPNPAAAAAHRWRVAHEQAILAEFMGLLAIPNLASDGPNIRRNAAAVSAISRKARRENAAAGSAI